jgi:hypothetical protein
MKALDTKTTHHIISAKQVAATSANAPDASNSQTEQAILELGMLAYLAESYNNPNLSASQKAAILAEFNTLRANYQVDGDSVTFTYTDANGQTKQVSITDPTALSLMQAMPTDISDYNALWTGENSPVVDIMTWLSTNADLQHNDNPLTQAAATLFFLAAAAGPIGQDSGIINEFLGLGFSSYESLIGAQTLAVFLQSNPALANVVEDCLSTGSQTGQLGEFASVFAESLSDPSSNPFVNTGIDSAASYQGRYWNLIFGLKPEEKKYNAAPVVQSERNQYLQRKV